VRRSNKATLWGLGMRLLLFIGLPALLVCSSAQGANYTSMGEGSVSCAVFGEDYRKAPTEVEARYFAWAQGFMSALNFLSHGAGGKESIMNATPLADQKRFVRDWCNKNPLANYYEAVFKLMDSLPIVDEQQKNR